MADSVGFDAVAEDLFENHDADCEERCTGIFLGGGWRGVKRFVGRRRICDVWSEGLSDVRIVAVKIVGVCEEEELVFGPSVSESQGDV